MTRRILVIPDIHGETFWKEPVQKYIDQVDKIVFLGDYLDPYTDDGNVCDPDEVYDNMMDIVNLKSINMDKVVLLMGNHDFHYLSKRSLGLARASRCDLYNWQRYNQVFNDHEDLFKIVHSEKVKDNTYVFSHAGLTTYWLNKVNSKFWKLNDRDISVADEQIIDMINEMLYDLEGQNMLAVVGRYRSIFGEKTGSVIWADIEEQTFPKAPKVYGLNKVFQVIGHTRMDISQGDMIEFDNLALIDSRQCFMIDEGIKEKIVPLKNVYGHC
jgi:predicted phosphodiesterase